MKIFLLPQAQEDLRPITDPLFSRIIQQLRNLSEFPDMGASMLGPFVGYRSFVVDFFRIVYRVLPGQIEIAYIRDCRRRPLA